MSDDDITVKPTAGGVFLVTCGEHQTRFQCPCDEDDNGGVINHHYVRFADLGDHATVERHVHAAHAGGKTVVVTAGNYVDLRHLSHLSARCKELNVPVIVRPHG